MARIKALETHEMSPEQQKACQATIEGPRGRVPPPMVAWLRNPELATRAQHLGALLRYSTSMETKLSELAILVCARHWTAHLEWTAHKRIALEAGLPETVIDAIAHRQEPSFDDDSQRVVYIVAHEIMLAGRLSDETYKLGEKKLGEIGMVELVALLGYYSMVALTLNVFELGIPEMWAPELVGGEQPPT